MLIKFSLFLFFFQILNVFTLQNKNLNKNDEDDLYGEELENVIEVYNKSNKLYKAKQVEYFSKYYEKADAKDISMNSANLMKQDEQSNKSFRKLNAIANNVIDGDKKLKGDGTLKNTLKAMLNDNTMKMKARVNAAKLAARLNDMPVSIQITNEDANKKPKDLSSHIIVPRISRIYRPDYYVENYKAGNWDA